jgi:hypothetical protein
MPKTAKRQRRGPPAPSSTILSAAHGKEPVVRLWTFPLLGIIGVGLLLRIAYIDQAMRYDEAVTYLRFASQPWATIISSYPYPNNHVFHSLLVKASISLLGDEPWTIRIPAFVAGVTMIPLVFLVGRRLVGPLPAYFGAALVASSGELTLYSANARGYTIVCVLTLVLLNLGLSLRTTSSARLWMTSVVVAALGLWSVPIMVYPAGALALWFALSALLGDTTNARKDLPRIALAAFATAIVTAILYSPIISREGLAALSGNKFVAASRWPVFFVQLADSIKDVLATWTLGLPLPAALALGTCVLVGLVEARRSTGLRVSIAGSVYVWCAIALLVGHHAPFARVWLFLFAPAALLAGCGLVRVLSQMPVAKRGLEEFGAELALLSSMALAATVLLSRDISKSLDTGTFPDAEIIAHDLSPVLRPGDRVLAPIPSNAPLQYYFLRQTLDTAYLSAAPGDSASVYLIVNNAEGFTTATRLTEPFLNRFTNGELIGRYPSAELYRLRHRATSQ